MKLSLLVTIIMLVGKVSAWLITGSTAIFSDAAESVVHVAATVLAAASLWYAVLPADSAHLYGHGKISYFSAGFEGALILVAALGVVSAGIIDLIRGPHVHDLGYGLLIIAFLTLINAALGFYLIHIGRKHTSIIVEANGRHVLTDMWTSAGVLVGVGLVMATGIVWLDPLVAILVGLNILVTAIRLIGEAFRGLMDVAEPALTKKIRNCLAEACQKGMILSFHQLRHRRVSDEIWIEVHLLMPGQMTMAQAHTKVNMVEGMVAGIFPDHLVHLTTHLEPVEHERAHPGGHQRSADPLQADDSAAETEPETET